ncbi:hypothetical protein B5S28_g2451 [[Candida] boidinii]|nr:hypothetical protein B5S28_g2451 [[Candida] boidinii]OWB73252.1 hypothetical protein B5S31_g2986 [[Candida] boidinii]GME99398.1 unnamed protein product [[Candida] boidinii]
MTFGEIEKIIIRREKSRSFNSSSTVFANVRFEIAQDAKEAIYNMNGYSYFNKLLIVKNLDEKIFQDRLKNSTNTKTAIWNQDTEDLDNATGDQIE